MCDKIPRPEHPRPDFMRAEFVNLNGEWQFEFDDLNCGLAEGWYQPEKAFGKQIVVPFAYQTVASGIGVDELHPYIWYRRKIMLEQIVSGRRALLHFGAVDYRCKVFINGQMVGEHVGGYTPFSFDIQPYLVAGENDLCLWVEDQYDATQPRGKQFWKSGLMGCWYTPVSGIWQTVYLEWVGVAAFEKIHITPNIDHHLAAFEISIDRLPQGHVLVKLVMSMEDTIIGQLVYDVFDRQIRMTVDMHRMSDTQLDAVYLWSPQSPSLYDVTLSLEVDGVIADEVKTYFGMRKVEVVGGQVLLNNQPIYQRLILDQGYWADTLLTPPSDAAIQEDIRLTKALGYNGARKHQKIEDPRYYYWADRMGLLVWGELPSAYEFSDETVQNLADTLLAFIHRDFNHPSIICWTTLNESWGVSQIYNNKRQQSLARMLYEMAKSADGTRLVSSNDGWEQVKTDICGLHDYSASYEVIAKHFADRKAVEKGTCDRRMCYVKDENPSGEEAFLVTEYGGIAMDDPKQTMIGATKTWGYHDMVKDEAAYLSRFQSVTDAIRDIPYCQGWCYTQLTDVMQETNGVLTIDRRSKVQIDRFRSINVNPIGW